MDLWAGLSNEFDFNILYTTRGHLTLAHTDSALRTMRWRAEVNKHLGGEYELILSDEIARLCTNMHMSREVRWPVIGALSHSAGSTARHDQGAWGHGEIRKRAEWGKRGYMRGEN